MSRPGVAGPSQQTREVVVDGVTFQSNGKTLVRKTGTTNPATSKVPSPTLDNSSPAIGTSPTLSVATTIASTTTASTAPAAVNSKPLVRTRNGLIAVDRFKQAGSKAVSKPPPRQPYSRPITGYPKRARPGRNLTLNKKKTVVKSKKWEKQCKHFTMTGMCGRGLTCKYQHDPTKIALCPLFLTEKCPYKDKPEQCSLSHDPTPERTPICVRFNSTGQCYKGSDCLYPHIRIGAKSGICRDFAVLGYCEKGASCESSHLKECPDFAETGVCKRMGIKGANGCHLPHVIRANQKKIGIATKAQVAAAAAPKDSNPRTNSTTPSSSPTISSAQPVVKKRYVPPGMVLGETSSVDRQPASDDQPGTSQTGTTSSSAGDVAGGPSAMPSADEFISLTFEESDDEDEDEDEEEEGDDEDEEEEDEDEDDEDADAEEVDKEMRLADDDDTGDAW